MRLSIFVLLLALPAFAGANPSLDKAATLSSELNYVDASKALDAALKQPGNDLPTLLKIYELQAVVSATLNQGAKAMQAFQALLALNPDFALAGNYPPRVTTAFYEARAWAASNGKLEVRALDAVLEPGNVKAVRVEVTKDPAKLVKKVRFHISGTQVVVPVVGGIASAAPKVPSREVTWWAQPLGDRDAVLGEVNSATWPRNETAPEKPAAAVVEKQEKPVAVEKTKPADAPVATPPIPAPEQPMPEQPMPEPPMVKAPAPSAPTSGKRIAAFSLLGGAAVCAGIGSAVGAMANATRAQVDGATTNGAGIVTGLNQRQAYELDSTYRGQATAANALFISAAALAVGGGTLFVLSLSDAKVAIVPTGPGLAVVGALP